METLENALRTAANAQRDREAGQGDLFGVGPADTVHECQIR